MLDLDGYRAPYVGHGASGARSSAQIDREELDTLALDDPRRDRLEASAQAWEDQARRLERGAATRYEERRRRG